VLSGILGKSNLRSQMTLKKWELSEGKLTRLQKKGIYTICCYVDDCPCSAKSTVCPRGFFSLFLQVLYGIDLAQRHNLDYYVDFGNHTYLYTEPSIDDSNLWNYYFEQSESSKSDLGRLVRNSFNEVYPLRIWRRKHFLRLNNAMKRLNFKEKIQQRLQDKREFFGTNKVLGVQIRRTDHGHEIEPVPINKFLEEIDKRLPKFDYLFVATDDNKTLSILTERYGSKLIVNNVHRSDKEEAVHKSAKFLDRYKLGEEVILDCYCLSLCKYAILMQSNISYSAVIFNPMLPYTLLELSSAKEKLKKRIHSFFDRFQSFLIH
jgi:hypothetical protein